MILILAVIFALGIAFFATQNTALVTLRLANYILPGVPLYLVMAISLLMGLFVAWLVGIIDNVGTIFTLRGKDTRLKQAHTTISSLETKIHNLEIENARLKGDTVTETIIHDNQKDSLSENRTEKAHQPLFPTFRSLFH